MVWPLSLSPLYMNLIQWNINYDSNQLWFVWWWFVFNLQLSLTHRSFLQPHEQHQQQHQVYQGRKDRSRLFPFSWYQTNKRKWSISNQHVYYKPTHTGVNTNWHSFTPRKNTKKLDENPFPSCFQHYVQILHFHAAFIKNNLLKNQFPAKLIDSVLTNFVEKNVTLFR